MTGILAGENTAMLCAVSLGAGVVLSACYDIFRIRRFAFREMSRPGVGKYRVLVENITVFAEDIVFALMSAVLFCVIFYRFSWGAVRWYALAAALISFSAYRATVGSLVMRIASRIIALIRRIYAFAAKLVKYCITAVRKLLVRIIVKPVYGIIRKAYTAAVYPLFLRRSEKLTAQLLDDAASGFENQSDGRTKKAKWIKQKTKPKKQPTKAG